MFGFCTRALAAIVFLASLAGPVVAGEPFQEHYDRGVKLYGERDYGQAIEEFQAAFAIRQLPRLLFNMAQAHRKLGHAGEALGLYQRYLRAATAIERSTYLGHTLPGIVVALALVTVAIRHREPAHLLPGGDIHEQADAIEPGRAALEATAGVDGDEPALPSDALQKGSGMSAQPQCSVDIRSARLRLQELQHFFDHDRAMLCIIIR